jgi:hypothetical protein
VDAFQAVLFDQAVQRAPADSQYPGGVSSLGLLLCSGGIVPTRKLAAAYQTLAFLDIIPTGRVMDTEANPSAWYAQSITLFILDIIQVGAFSAALLAYHANRPLPGFLPARHPGPRPS